MRTDTITEATTDRIEQALTDLEHQIGARRHLQMQLLSELDRRQVPIGDGARSLQEWVAARLDVTTATARRLTQTAHRLEHQHSLAEELASGAVSFDRVVEESRLVAAGADQQLVAASRGWDLGGVRRMVARHHRISSTDEQQVFRDRYLTLQPSLDEASYRLWGHLPGVDGRIVEAALTQRADQFPSEAHGQRAARSQRHADALVSIAQDSLDRTNPEETSSTPLVSIFLDAELAARTNAEAGAELASGPRIGPLTLEQILCDGQVEILATGSDGTPLAVGSTSRTITPKLRRWIVQRDGGMCTIDGCQSRYRLQPHHITPRSQGGTHHPHNLTTLCWYHHHIAIHRNGYRIEPTPHPNADNSSHPTEEPHPEPPAPATYPARATDQDQHEAHRLSGVMSSRPHHARLPANATRERAAHLLGFPPCRKTHRIRPPKPWQRSSRLFIRA